MEQLLKKAAQILRNNKKKKWVRGGVMSAACLVVFMTTYLLILPAITINLDQADEEPGFDVEAQGELLISNEDQSGNDDENVPGDADLFAASDNSGSVEQISFQDEGDTSALFGGDSGDSDEVFFSDSDGDTAGYAGTSADETTGPFEYTYTEEETGWVMTVDAELLNGAVLPAGTQMTVKLIRPDSETDIDTFASIENAFAETFKEANLQAAEDPLLFQLTFERDGEILITEDTFAPLRVTLRFYESAPEGDMTIATGEYSSLTGEGEIRQTLLIPENNSYTTIADLENAASIIGIAKVTNAEAAESEEKQEMTEAQETEETQETEIEITDISEEAEAYTETESEEETERFTETATEEETERYTETATEEETERYTETATEEETESLAETETEEATESITEAETEEATENLTEAETEEATESITDAETEEATESITDAETEEATESITDAETEEATESITDAETEEETEALESVYEDELEEETESITEEETEEETESISEAETEELLSTITYEGSDYTIQLTYGADAEIPEDAFLDVREIEKGSKEYEMYLAASGIALENEGKKNGSAGNVEARFFDITIMQGEQKIEPKDAVSVDISYHEALQMAENGEVNAVHFDDKGETSVLDVIPQGEGSEVSSVSFDTDSFSVFGIVYTVDFHYEVNGQIFEYSIPGGGYIALSDLISALGIMKPNAENETDQMAKFMDNIENVVFSKPEFMSVTRVEENTTVGAIKDQLGLVCENSVLLKEEALESINSSEIKAGDWALISVIPFETEENLTVTLKDGQEFCIRVTDAQLKKTILSADGNAYEITVTYFGTAQIPDGAELKVREILKDDEDYTEYCRKAIAKTESRNSEGSLVDTVGENTGNPTEVPEIVSEHGKENAGSPTEEDSEKTSEELTETFSATAMMPENDEIFDYARFFDIQIWADGQKVEPQSDVYVTISLADVPEDMASEPQVVHFGKNGAELLGAEEQRKDGEETALTEFSFTTDGFSVYAVIVIKDCSGIFTLSGEDFTVKITYTEEAELPLGTVMTVRELEQNSEEFLHRLGETWVELNREYLEVEEKRANYNEGMGLLPEVNPVNVDSVRFFDINFTYEGETIEPKVPVKVEIIYDKGLSTLGAQEPMAGVAHFAEEGLEMIEDVQTTFDEAGGVKTFCYEQRSFSDTGTYVAQETKIEKASMKIGPAPVLRSAEDSGLLLAAGNGKGDGNDEGNGDDENDEENDNEPHISHAPQAGKTLTPNDDGTYKLALNVTGEADTSVMESVTKSNVLIVMDRSSSMVDNYVNDGLNVTQVASTDSQGMTNDFTPDPGTTYYGVEQHNNNRRYFPLTYTNGVWYCENFSYTSNDFNPATKVYARGNGDVGKIYTGTVQSRMTEEQSALNDLIGALLSKNMTGTLQDGTPLNDIIEISVISFGDTRFQGKSTEAGWTTNFDNLMAAVGKSNATSGTNWEEALIYAKEIADAKKQAQPDEDMYVIFLTDGEPTAIHGETGGAHHYGSTGGGYISAYTPARDDARALVDAKYHFYGVYTFNNIGADYLQRLINVAYGSDQSPYSQSDNTAQTDALNQYFYDASDPSGMADAFQNILSTISNSVAFGRVSITDGITTDAATTAVINGSAQGFRYSVRGQVGELYSVTTSGNANNPQVEFKIGTNTYSGNQVQKKTGEDGKEYYSVTVGTTEYKMALATIDENQKVTWDLSAIGTLMDGYTYSVEFDIWPNQDAYDYVADLNNGMKEWDTSLPGYQNLLSTKGYEIGGVAQYPSIVRKPDGNGGYVFSVLTNTEQEVKYSIVKTETENGQTTTTYDGPYTIPLNPPEPMDLLDTRMSVKKIWDDKLDEQQLAEILYTVGKVPTEYKINLLVWEGETLSELQSKIDQGNTAISAYIAAHPGENMTNAIAASNAGFYKNEIVGWDPASRSYVWNKDFTVAPGLIVPLDHAVHMGETIVESNKVNYNGKTYYILDQGHYYTITEPGIDRHYELNTVIYHPMIIDNELKQVTIENGTVVKSETLVELDADNTIKGGINVQKIVKDTDGKPITNSDDKFFVTLTMKNKDGTPYTDFDYRIFYGENNPKYANTQDYPNHYTGHVFGTAAAKPADNQDEAIDNAEPPVGKCYIAGNTDGKVMIGLYIGDTLRVINVPSGVTYSVEEDQSMLPKLPDANDSLYTFENVLYEIKVGDGAYTPDNPNSESTYTVRGNSASRATVVNAIPSGSMRIIKISEGNQNKLMGGVWFKLYYDAEGKRQILKDSIGEPLGVTIDHEDGTKDEGVIVTDSEGNASLGSLIAGDYYLKEIKTNDGYVLPESMIPITITKQGNNLHVTYNQTGNSLSQNGEGVRDDGNSIAIVINNDTGVELPSTGGPGINMIYLLGITLIGFASAGYAIKRRTVHSGS